MNFAQKIKEHSFVLSVEVDPPRGSNVVEHERALLRLFTYSKVKIDAVDINSGSMARVGMDAIVYAGMLKKGWIGSLYPEVIFIPHVTARDSNLIGLQAQLLGAQAMGLETILVITGDPPSCGNHPEGTMGVYETDSIGLIRLIKGLNEGRDMSGKEFLDRGTNIMVGAALNLSADNQKLEVERMMSKLEAGVSFFMTQPIFDEDCLERFERIWGKIPVPIIVGIWQLDSFEQASRLMEKVPGFSMPLGVLRDLEDRSVSGVKLARRIFNWARANVAGAYLISPARRPDRLLEVLNID